MDREFNPLKSKLLFAQPKRLHLDSAWVEHVPFAMFLMELQKPRTLVELGTHWGISYCAFCQAIAESGLQSRCFAVDTWAGDSHVGHYGNQIYEDLMAHHKQYESFSKLLRMTFDEALNHIEDQSVDLLHIDGLHTYEAVKHDFESWLPKMSKRGIVLFHDTAVKERGFGVYKFWSELAPRFLNFNFEHGFGLGVLAVGSEQSDAVTDFFRMANAHPATTRQLFAALGGRFQSEAKTAELARLNGIERSRDYRWGHCIVSPLRHVKHFFTGKTAEGRNSSK